RLDSLCTFERPKQPIAIVLGYAPVRICVTGLNVVPVRVNELLYTVKEPVGVRPAVKVKGSETRKVRSTCPVFCAVSGGFDKVGVPHTQPAGLGVHYLDK